MKGYSHALSGAALWTAVAAPSVNLQDFTAKDVWNIPLTSSLLNVSPSTYGLGLMLSAGAALLCDIDHHNGTIAHSLPSIGPIPSPTAILCRFVGKISGGHRHGTHSILGIIAFTVLAFLAGLVNIPIKGHDVAIGSGIFALFLTAFTLKVFKVGKSDDWLLRWVGSLGFAGLITWFFPSEWTILPVVVALGCLAHILGDMLTVGGVPWLYPWTPDSPKWWRKIPVLNRMWQNNGWFAFPILGKTDSGQEKGPTREKLLGFLLSAYIVSMGMMTTFVYAGIDNQLATILGGK